MAMRASVLCSNSLVRAPKENGADGLEQKVRKPEDQMGGEFRTGLKRLTEKEKAVVNGHQQQGYADAYVRLAPVHLDAKRNTYQRKPEASERKSDLAMHVDADRRSQVGLRFSKLFADFGGLGRIGDAKAIGHHLGFDFLQFIAQLEEG